MIKESVKKCDYLLLSCKESERKAYFIELKGQDYKHGIDQLIETIKMYNNKLQDFNINARLVYSSKNFKKGLYSNEKELKKLVKSKGGTFDKKSNVMEESI